MEQLSLSRERVGLTMGAPGARSQGHGVLVNLYLILKAKGSLSGILNQRDMYFRKHVPWNNKKWRQGAILEQEE